MPNVPAHCPSCGALFESHLIHVREGVKGVTFSNVGVSCPFCGGEAQVADGTFDAIDGVLELVTGPDTSAEMLRRLYSVVRDAYSGADTLDEAEAKAAQIKPEFGRALALIKNRGPLNKALLLALMFLLYNCQFNLDFNVTIDVNTLIEQMIDKDPKALVERLEKDLRKDRR